MNEVRSAGAVRQARYRQRQKEKHSQATLPFRFVDDQGRTLIEIGVRSDGCPALRLCDPTTGKPAATITAQPGKGGLLLLYDADGKQALTLYADAGAGHAIRKNEYAETEKLF